MSVDPANLSIPDSSVAEPSAKRRRTTSMTTEERKEARAHRNRIAAQNSRDRRKAHYTNLEHRIAELEAENQQLRAQSPSADAARENAELRERIKTLESGWQTVLTALAAQGLPLPGMAPAAPSTASCPPVIAAQLPVSLAPTTFPLSPAPTVESPLESVSHDFDSPSPSAFAPSPLVSDFDMQPQESQQPLFVPPSSTSESTRHLARMANTSSEVSQQRVVSPAFPMVTSPASLALASVRITPVKSTTPSRTRRWRISSAKSSCQQPRRRVYLRLRLPTSSSQKHPPPPPPHN